MDEQQRFLDAVAEDPTMTEAQKAEWFLIAARDYGGKLEALREAAERVRQCYDNIETRHETMPAAMHALDMALRGKTGGAG